MSSGTILIIGAGGVGSVVVHKCAQNSQVFKDIHLASRTIGKPNAVAADVKKRWKVNVTTHAVDADNVPQLTALIKKIKPEVVLNVALPYQDLHIMDACLEAGVHYIDTANYEPLDEAKFEYSWQWAYQDRFKKKGIMAVLGAGFDPGNTNMYCAYILKHHFDKIRFIDILDCNAGNHGLAFATNFNPEINIREVTQVVRHWAKGKWIDTPPILDEKSTHFMFDYPVVGKKDSYLLYHEEEESLVKFMPGLERIRFWMTFSQNYLTHLRVLQDVGMTRIDEVDYEGKKIVPIKFLKEVLPNPASLATNYTGKTVIGCIITGVKNGKESTKYIYNVCDHAQCFKEVGSQAISYTTAVPAMSAAMMVMKGVWKGAGVWNVEQLDCDPVLEVISKNGLPFQVVDYKPLPDKI